MAKANTKIKDVDWPGCQLMLVVEPGPGARERLDAVLSVAAAAAVLIRPAEGHNLGGGEAKALVDIAQAHNAAAILFGDVTLARALKADGVHLPAGPDLVDRIEDARAGLGRDASVGVAPGLSRHSAMEAGEAGADYIAFGAEDGSAEARRKRDDHVEWWAEIFEVPCVAFDVTTIDELDDADRNGADFVAMPIANGASPEALRKTFSDVQRRLDAGPAQENA